MQSLPRLDKQNVADVLALTPLQEGLLFHYLTAPDSDHYFEQLSIRLEGRVDAELVRHAFTHVLKQNEMLRAIFRWERLEKPVQIVLKDVPLPFRELDLTEVEPARREAVLLEVKENDRKQKLDIRTEPFRILICRLADHKYELIISHHHMLFDGWSQSILLKEWIDAYEELLFDRIPAGRVKEKFKEFIKWNQSRDKVEQERFWRSDLQGFDTKTRLPLERRKTDHASPSLRKAVTTVPAELSEKLEQFMKEHEVTMAAVIYAAWGILLMRYSGSDDVLFGTTVSGRPAELRGIGDVVGLFINTVPLRVKAEAHATVAGLIAQIHEALREREEYESTPLIDIASYSELGAGGLFDSIVVIENYPLDQLSFHPDSGIRIGGYDMFEFTHYDLSLTVNRTDSFRLELAYHEGVCKKDMVGSMLEHLLHLLTAMIQTPDAVLPKLEMLSPEEKKRLVFDLNETEVPYPKTLSISEWFERKVQENPEREALVFEDETMTYRQLNETANRLAWYLRAKGVTENTIVGVMLERSFDMIVAILAVLKVGGAYLPVDPDYPEERIRYLIAHSRTTLMLTRKRYMDSASNLQADAEWIDVSEISSQRTLPDTDLDVPYNPERLLYVLYTSGSTGTPKGVMVKSHAFINLLHWFVTEFQIGESDRTLLIAPVSFDLVQKNLFSAIVTGGTLVLYTPGLYDYNRMSDVIERHGITLLNCAPSAFHPLIDFNISSDFRRIRTLRNVFLGGEPIYFNKLLPWIRSSPFACEITNTYGPTECTDIASFYRVDTGQLKMQDNADVPIGKPIHNVQLYIMDAHLHLLPEGVPGELYIGGTGLAQGYYGSQELTSERFVSCPHVSGGIVYRTGDLARLLPDGNVAYIGRLDHQIKINGMRMELGEVEAALRTIPGILEAVVAHRQRAGGLTLLHAFFTAQMRMDETEVRDRLRKRLPDYMVPARFMQLDSLPLTPNGKIDRQALLKPETIPESGIRQTEPDNETEGKLLAIWRKVLQTEMVGIHDTFFDAGGNSVLLIGLHAQVDKVYPGQTTITDFFAYPTVSRLAAFLNSNSDASPTESQAQWKGIRFPEPFYSNMLSNSNRISPAYLAAEFQEDTVHKLTALCRQSGITMRELLLSMFVYLLAEMTGRSPVSVYTMAESGSLVAVDADLSGMNDFHTLFHQIRGQVRHPEHLLPLPPKRVRIGTRSTGGQETPVLFYEHDGLAAHGYVWERFDLAAEVKIHYFRVSAVCRYNAEKLRNDKMKQLLDGYVELVELLAREYQIKEGVI